MLTRHTGLTVFLLFAVVGHAELLEHFVGRRAPWWQVGFGVIFAPIALVLLGEWIAGDAESRRFRRLGWWIAGFGAAWHLVLDAACLALPLLGTPEAWLGVAGALPGATVMALALRRALRGWRFPDEPEPDPAAPPPPGVLARLRREAGLVGGDAVALFVVSAGFVALGAFALLRRPEQWRDPRPWAAIGFFGFCALVSVQMGLERRAMLLGAPGPLSRLTPRWLRRACYHAVREGLLLVERRGATLYPWEALASVSVGTVSHNAALLIELAPGCVGERLRAADGSPRAQARWVERQLRAVRLTRALYGVDLMALSPLTADGPGVLARQLTEALASEEARASLPAAADLLLRRR
jgi:hypothetical protein